ncbi:MAG: hypothetical protein COC01_05620 [Bacteroidetes bacterium]|nr:MAG: hypothetical protein COC01_05620 [Bacteroidota bacterium]
MASEKTEKKKDDIFGNERIVLDKANALLENNALTTENFLVEFQGLTKQYSELLGQTKLVTSVSDRLQGKLNRAYDKIHKVNSDLESRNIELQETIDELTKARASKKAATLVIIVAVGLFFISEGILEPYIEDHTENPYLGFGLKGGIALLIKPIETIIEKHLLKQALKKKEEDTKKKKEAVTQ